MSIDLEALSAPFPGTAVHWRVGATTRDKKKGLALAFIDARDVYARLDDVCGPAGWQCRHMDGGDGRLTCEIGVRINDEWIWKSDGAGAREASKGLSEQDANKGDYSDALKRAAVAWGIGRYLYDLPAPWVALDTNESNGKIYVNGFADGVEAYLAELAQGRSPKPPSAKPKPRSKADSRETFDRLVKAVRSKESEAELDKWLDNPQVKEARISLPNDWKQSLTNEINETRTGIQANAQMDRQARVEG